VIRTSPSFKSTRPSHIQVSTVAGNTHFLLIRARRATKPRLSVFYTNESKTLRKKFFENGFIRLQSGFLIKNMHILLFFQMWPHTHTNTLARDDLDFAHMLQCATVPITVSP